MQLFCMHLRCTPTLLIEPNVKPRVSPAPPAPHCSRRRTQIAICMVLAIVAEPTTVADPTTAIAAATIAVAYTLKRYTPAASAGGIWGQGAKTLPEGLSNAST
jgi:hypothetical protein